ncbi:MAG: hypothetical protein LQ346_005013 [Caloplaca aetnensis]|nr:MAG: hypothetical protein LQ346_005013 [Caloplaca aetnensis]
MSKNQAQQVEDKAGEPIKEGDQVWTKMRGGKHEGEVRHDQDRYKGTQVEAVVTSQEEAEEKGVKNPPKVLFTDQHGHDVAHNPGTLEHTGDT